MYSLGTPICTGLNLPAIPCCFIEPHKVIVLKDLELSLFCFCRVVNCREGAISDIIRFVRNVVNAPPRTRGPQRRAGLPELGSSVSDFGNLFESGRQEPRASRLPEVVSYINPQDGSITAKAKVCSIFGAYVCHSRSFPKRVCRVAIQFELYVHSSEQWQPVN